jgi:ubiquinone/menaquinone biosynthesis C-methylase UbiE
MKLMQLDAPRSRSRQAPNDIAVEPHIKVAIHGKFYHWAKEQVRGKVVLDAGCGQGYGSALLSETAKKVVAVDVDPSIVARASSQHGLPNVEFEVMDCQYLTFASHAFDVVVSNALLEYLEDVPAFVAEAYRVLKPGGTIICGTKNLELSLKKPDGTPRYNNHLQEYTPDSLKAELERCFSGIRIYGEQMNARSEAYIMDARALKIEDALVKFNVKKLAPRRFRRWVRKLLTGIHVSDVHYEDFEIVEQDLDRALYVIGVGVKNRR